jgi:exopolyphosphatase/guanosine-5'-triphosphate,3'-diphosphate pyrophosphatase
MKYASIDIGTNTILMLLGEIGEGSGGETTSVHIKEIEDFYEVPRLGKNVSRTKMLDDGSINRALRVLHEYKIIVEKHGVDKIVASATSAVREARNGRDFMKRVKDETGIDVELIDGKLEAELGFIAASSGAAEPNQPTLVVDVGGGSTELSYGKALKPEIVWSSDIGAVRVTENFFRHDPPTPEELGEASEFTEEKLSGFPFEKIAPRCVIGVGGTATTLALVAQKRYQFDSEAVTNYSMSIYRLREVLGEIELKTANEILELTTAAEGRADVLVAGGLILLKILEASKTHDFLTTDRGLRYGYMIYKHRQLHGK